MTTTTVKEHPILFNGDEVRLTLDGSKTQARRVCRDQSAKRYEYVEEAESYPKGEIYTGWAKDCGFPFLMPTKCPYGQPGDHRWVRETWASTASLDYVKPRSLLGGFPCQFRAGGSSITGIEKLVNPGKWRPSIHMPRLASRITLEVTDVRVERVQDISEVNAKAEGVEPDPPKHWFYASNRISKFQSLWDSLNAKRGYGWAVNPWVWVVEFKRVEGE